MLDALRGEAVTVYAWALLLRHIANLSSLTQVVTGCPCDCHFVHRSLVHRQLDGLNAHSNHVWTVPMSLSLGGKLQLVCDAVNITLNKNSISGDSPGIPTGEERTMGRTTKSPLHLLTAEPRATGVQMRC